MKEGLKTMVMVSFPSITKSWHTLLMSRQQLEKSAQHNMRLQQISRQSRGCHSFTPNKSSAKWSTRLTVQHLNIFQLKN